MRLILSRKGFDSSAGGCPSPVLPDGSLCVLPVPSHFHRGPDPGNTLYVASDSWRLPECRPLLPGSGVFRRLEEQLLLSDPQARLATRWRLPGEFLPVGGKPALSYHANPDRW